ncbi:MAG: hypothetical protein E7Z93_04135 [Cyanobacteria bacterium SIG32]|nr:hypothetical protein [Cyanobacteria bacterium SIG32]
MNKRLLLTALLLSSLTISGHAYGAERVVVDETTSASVISQAISGISTTGSSGGAMLVKGAVQAATANITNSTYTGNSSDSWGGAAYVTNGTLDIKGSTFENNLASAGGALAGGTNNSNIIIDNTNFTTNKADWVGALGVFKNAKITNSTFTGNQATDATKEGGGAMFVGSVGAVAILDNVTFTGNTSASVGGAIATRVGENANGTHNNNSAAILNITNSTFEGNTAATTGGAIDNHFYNENNGITNSTFKNNYAANGGAIYNHGDEDLHEKAANLKVTGGTFEGNYTTTGNGGAIYNAADATISGVEFKDNYAAAGNGGAIFANGTASSAVTEIINSTFTGNEAANGYGGAAYVTNSTMDIKGSEFTGNTALYAGAITSGTKNSMLKIDDTDFTNNSAKWIGAVGVFKKAEITNSTFTGNQATGKAVDGFEGGGAMFVGSEGAVAVLDNVTFTGNTSESSGGAIGTRVGENASGSHNNNSQAVLNITNSTFEGNTAATTGGAIDNHFYNENSGITNSTFTNNSAKDGGAIYNHGDLDNQNKAANLNITGGSFTGNTATGNGGAIYNQADATIKGVEFSGNKAESGYGGSIYVNTKVSDSQINDSTTTISESLFEGNSASIGGALFNHNGKTEITLTEFNNNKADFGGAIYSTTSSHAELSIKDSAFTGNTAKSAGAVDAFGKTTIENVVFTNNSATDANDDGGGALFLGSVSDSTLKNVTFDGNTSAGVGGAIATRTAAQGNNSALKMTITDASFTNNSAAKEGGAIYSAADVTINAQDSNVTFSGNTAADGGDIYMSEVNSELKVNVADGKTVSSNGGISGAQGYTVTVQSVAATGASSTEGTGTLNLDSYLKGANMTVEKATLALGANADVDSTSSVLIKDGGFDTANGVAQEFGDNITFEGTVDVAADVDLGGGASDDLSAIIEASTSGNSAPTIVISKVNAIGNTTASNKAVDLRTALGLGEDVTLVTTGATASDTLTPIRWLKGSVDENGIVTYAPRGNSFKDFNPAVMAGPVAAQLGGFLSQVNSYNQAFMNMDMKMLMTREERQALRMRNSYAATQTPQVFSPTYLPEKEKAGWVRPYASFEKVGLDGGPRVNNVMYGSYFGADSDMYELKNGAEAQFSVYAGYTGSHQTFSGNSIYQNGGTLGLTGIVYKDNFFTALTANTGASVADMSTAFGSEDMPMLMAGVASKTGYNWELAKGKFIVQPSYLMSYTFVNAFDYTNAAGVRIESDPLNAIQIAPGVKFIGNLKNGWQPYVNLRMVWNLMGKSDFTAANTSLPELSVKPYFEYGVGLQKRWGERFTGFGQAMLRAGGRTGIGLGFGFRWALGKAPAKSFNTSDAKNIIQPTSVKLSNIK